MPISTNTPLTESTKPVAGSRTRHSSPQATATAAQPALQRSASEQPQDAMFTTDLRGVITSCTQGMGRYGFAPKDLVGRNLADIYDVEEPKSFVSHAIASVLETGQFESGIRCRTQSGQDVDVRLCLTLLRDANAAPSGILALAKEATSEIAEKKAAGDESLPGRASGPIPLARREIGGTQFLIASN